MTVTQPAPACVSYHPGWVLDQAELLDRLGRELPWEQRDITLFGRTVATPRLTCWFGEVAYVYSGVVNPPRPLPPELAALRDALTDLTGVALNSVLANLYRNGTDSTGYHSDDEPQLGDRPTICSVSLGARRTFTLRHQATRERWSWLLGEGDLLLMRDESQADYRHAVPKTSRPIGPRLNLTFRRMLPESEQ